MQDKLQELLSFLKGKKTIATGLLAIAYGLYFGEVESVLLGFGLIGIRDGLSTEIAKTVTQSRKRKRK